jgi:dipeptidyl aminopeptidase/acylaminoacyl peptidase
VRQALVSTIVVLGLVAAAPGAAAFAGADGRVVLSSGRDLLTVLPDGSALQPLAATPGVEEAQASWSPDGSRVAFRVGTAGTSDVLQVAVMNADGSGRTVLTGGDHHNSQPGWSPDGRQIVFRRSVPGVDLSGDIWVMGADGSAPHPLLALPGDERYPSLSPDGTHVAFTTRPAPTDDVEIAVALVDGAAVTAITDNAVFDSSPAWSPDGRRIAFERGPAGDDPGNDVWSMAADGTDQRQLTTSAGLDEGPAWSPGGSRIAFTSTRAGSSDIWTMAADGTDQRPLTALPGTEESPDWQPLPGTSAGLTPVGASPSQAPAPVAGAAPSRAPRLSLRLAAGQSLRTLRRKGLVVRIACSKPCRLSARLRLDRVTAARLRLAASGTVGRASRTLRAAGTAKLAIRLTRRARARIATVKRARLTLRITASADGKRQSTQRRVTFTRTGAALRP